MCKDNGLVEKYQKLMGLKYPPSEYQAKYYDWVVNGQGNAIIDAKAGSGKTYSIVNSMKLIDDNKKVLFIAFNKSIQQELQKKTKELHNVKVYTLHGLGFNLVRMNLGSRGKDSGIEVKAYKYNDYLKKHLSELTDVYTDELMDRKKAKAYMETVMDLLNLGRLSLAKTEADMEEVAKHYAMPLEYDECGTALKLMQWGMKNYKEVDFVDMLWLPIVLDLKPFNFTYDWVFLDECQDASKAAIQMFRKCIKPDGRFVAVGDEKQCIYSFAGADSASFQFLKNQPNTTLFTLPISYRCGKKIIDFTHKLVPDILAREDAPDGEVINDSEIDDLKEGDMVLCRTKSPLFQLYTYLLDNNIPSYIKGQDIGKGLEKLVSSIDDDIDELNVRLDKDGVFIRLYEKLFNMRDNLMRKRGLDKEQATFEVPVMELYDSITALNILSRDLKYKDELIEKIRKIFTEKSDEICLSTVHKAKGLEADNVYILCPDTMPSKRATEKWEIQQEKNLMYVAYTRAKKKLGFLQDDIIKPSGAGMDGDQIISDLNRAEKQVCKILKRNPIEALPEDTKAARTRLKNKTRINASDLKPTVRKKQTMKVRKSDDSLDQMLDSLKEMDLTADQKRKLMNYGKRLMLKEKMRNE